MSTNAITTTTNARPAPWSPPVWDEERVALAKKMVCPPGTTDTEFQMFIAWCKRTGLDPFIKQAYLVERRAKDGNGNWVSKQEPMAAEAGLASVADAQADFRGLKAAAVYAGDEFMVDEVTQTIVHRWSVEARAAKRNVVIGAWAKATREGRDVPLVWLPLESRLQKTRDGNPTQFWAKDAAGMIVKCARAMAYRLAYPSLFSGVVIAEERRDDDEVDVTPPPPPAPGVTKTARLAARLGAGSSTSATPPPVTNTLPADAPPIPEDVRDRMDADRARAEAEQFAEERREAQASPPPASPPRAVGNVAPLTHLRFGPAKGKALTDCTGVELHAALDVARAAVAKAKGNEPWLDATREGIAAVEAELVARENEPANSPEPGSEG